MCRTFSTPGNREVDIGRSLVPLSHGRTNVRFTLRHLSLSLVVSSHALVERDLSDLQVSLRDEAMLEQSLGPLQRFISAFRTPPPQALED
jgi:hypothetical protein